MLLREVRIFLTALMFFTRIPCPSWVEDPQEYLGDTSRYFPLVGWVVGAMGAIIIWGGSLLWPLPIALVLSLIATVLLTGALHEDGFIDACDGFGGGWTSERILAIMKDSRIGAFGVIGIGLLMGLKIMTLMALPAAMLSLTLIAGHSLSRFASISLLYTHEYVRNDAQSKSKPVVRRMTLGELVFAGTFGMLPLLVMSVVLHSQFQGGGFRMFFWCLLAAGVIRWALGRYFQRRIGGYTGDCLGAVQQIAEVAFYVTLAALV